MYGLASSKDSCPGYWPRGFTLIELTIAMSIFAIVISAVYGAYRATFQITRGSEYQAEVAQHAGIVLDRIAEDLGSLVISKGGFFLGEEHGFAGFRGDSLSFISYAHIILSKSDPPAGRAMIRYSVEQNNKSGLLRLYRSDTILLPGVEPGKEEESRDILCDGLKEVRFTYHDKQGNPNAEWLSNGGGMGGEKPLEFPAVVEVELHFSEFENSKRSYTYKTAIALPMERPK